MRRLGNQPAQVPVDAAGKLVDLPDVGVTVGVVLHEPDPAAHVEDVAHGRAGVAAAGEFGDEVGDRPVGVEQISVHQRRGHAPDDGLGHRHQRVRAVRRALGAVPLGDQCAILQDHQCVGVGVGQHRTDRRLATVDPDEPDPGDVDGGGLTLGRRQRPRLLGRSDPLGRQDVADVPVPPSVVRRQLPVVGVDRQSQAGFISVGGHSPMLSASVGKYHCPPCSNQVRSMSGFPPSPPQQVTLSNWQQPDSLRWSFRHMREIIPTHPIAGGGVARPLTVHEQDLGDIPVPLADTPSTVSQILDSTFTDGLLVLHDGAVVTERYFEGMTASTRHLVMSVSKSIVGCVAGVLVERGQLDPRAAVTAYVPEVAGSGYDGASVRDVLDMRTGVAFSEAYTSDDSEVRVMERSMGWAPRRPDDPHGAYAYLTTLGTRGSTRRRLRVSLL